MADNFETMYIHGKVGKFEKRLCWPKSFGLSAKSTVSLAKLAAVDSMRLLVWFRKSSCFQHSLWVNYCMTSLRPNPGMMVRCKRNNPNVALKFRFEVHLRSMWALFG